MGKYRPLQSPLQSCHEKSLSDRDHQLALQQPSQGALKMRRTGLMTWVRLLDLVYHESAPYYAPSEFAFEIGSGLLTEVRRLQSLLGERDKAIQDMKEEKDDLEKSVENLRAALRQQEQSTGRFFSASFLTSRRTLTKTDYRQVQGGKLES